jgi:hypothetical protein
VSGRGHWRAFDAVALDCTVSILSLLSEDSVRFDYLRFRLI